MTQIQNIIKQTNPSLIVTGENMTKGMYGKRQIVVKYNQSKDLFNVYAFTLKGTNITNEVKINDVFVFDLKSTIERLK